VPSRNRHRGDSGETHLLSGHLVRKDDPRVECMGSIDELSSFLGLARVALEERASTAGVPEAIERLRRIQGDLYILGAQVARRDRDGTGLTTAETLALERDIEQIDAQLPPLDSFILPGGGTVAALLHVARAVCRRAERQAVYVASFERLDPPVVPYLNRLSLALFSMARQAAHVAGAGDDRAECE
jgi:cob(I)alamin adenosyltransferase